MVGELIMLPLRVGVRATQLGLRVATETVAVAANATGQVIDSLVSRPRAQPGSQPFVHEREREPAEASAAAVTSPPPSSVTPPPADSEPVHVSEEPELVEEVADPGAEDGAGATIHIAEPWHGYDEMKADDLIDRLAGATAAELAAVQLYESERKGRATVLEAVERELQSNGSGSQR